MHIWILTFFPISMNIEINECWFSFQSNSNDKSSTVACDGPMSVAKMQLSCNIPNSLSRHPHDQETRPVWQRI